VSVRFLSVHVSGYRGRHFKLDMDDGKQSIFVMDGNTGKTTTIELLRWCFRFKQTEAKYKFRHMWSSPSHVLDFALEEKQKCWIEIQFEDDSGKHYKFIRETIGKHDRSKARNKETKGDIIDSITDTLEIDRGGDVLQGNKVNEFLNEKFRFGVSSDYFCFDGEKAREMIRMATSEVKSLIDLIRQRTTHAQVQLYMKRLEDLRDNLLTQSAATLTDRAHRGIKTKLKTKRFDLSSHNAVVGNLEDEEAIYDSEVTKLTDDIRGLSEKIRSAESETIRRKADLEHTRDLTRKEISILRAEVYNNCRIWMEPGFYNLVTKVKDVVRERGHFPDPYHRDLITECLKKPPTCQICGRVLDTNSLKRVKQLEVQIATHDVQNFLSSKFVSEDTIYDVARTRKEIQNQVKRLKLTEENYGLIALSSEDESLFTEKSENSRQRDVFHAKLIETQTNLESARDYQKILQHEIEQILQKSTAFQKNKPLLDEIDKLEIALDTAHDKMRKRTIEVIGEVISRAASSILGKDFTAMLSEEDGLMLGEKGFYNAEIGGYSGRLILSYLFAEAMSQVDPIIIDTPVGNVGTHRAALAHHLANNHSQVILLCLPTELGDFAEHFVNPEDFKTIRNLQEEKE